ncbi:MAG TPA: MBL fold metallo-hydrolase [Bacteroidia bacterium]|jgi:hydroxyacylglutathione hydrolase|nr:MBL fold metallo-hydrolase [Bacteroidia bacterium]
MTHQKHFEFNAFSENTYIIYNDAKEAAIIDPGCSTPEECDKLAGFIRFEGLKPVLLLNTHCHIDHVLGNHFVYKEYGLAPLLHRNELTVLHSLSTVAAFYGVEATPSPEPLRFIEEHEKIQLGDITLEVIYAPGHSPGGVCFYSANDKKLWGGDVLFRESIGRTDLPGGDYDTLEKNILTKIFTLPDDVEVFSGHGIPTTIGYEKKFNPFVGEARLSI